MSFIGINITGMKELAAKFSNFANDVIDAGVEEANKNIIAYEKTNEPSYKYVSLEQAYGGRSTLRAMQIWVFTHQPTIPYQRSNELANGWVVEGIGRKQTVVNKAPGAAWVKDAATQARMMMLRGWTTIQQDVIDLVGENLIAAFTAGVKRAIHRLGLD